MRTMFKDGFSDMLFRQALAENRSAYLDALEHEAAVSPIARSRRFDRRMQILSHRAKNRKAQSRKVVVRLAVSFAIILAVASSVLLASPQVRATVSEVIIQWFNKFTSFGATQNSITETPLQSSPTNLPEGYEQIDSTRSEELASTIYADADGHILVFTITPVDGKTSVNNENTVYEKRTAKNIEYHLFMANDGEHNNTIVWDLSGYRFSLDGDVPMDVLFDIAKSVN